MNEYVSLITLTYDTQPQNISCGALLRLLDHCVSVQSVHSIRRLDVDWRSRCEATLHGLLRACPRSKRDSIGTSSAPARDNLHDENDLFW